MYVDKKLSGVKAVQTLSRLNRTHAGKEDTFVLDFVNDREDILKSFQPYYELTTMNETTNPNHLYDLKNKMDALDIYHQSEVDSFAQVFYKPNTNGFHAQEQAKLYRFIDPAIVRYKDIHEDIQDEFKGALKSFVNIYSFLSQIMPFQDIDLEKLFSYGKLLLIRLPKTDISERLKLDNEVDLQYYRLTKITEDDLVLQIQGEDILKPATEAGIKRTEDEKEILSKIINVLNDKYGTDFTEADKLFFDQIEEELFADGKLKQWAVNNPEDAFKFPFDEMFISKLIERMDSNGEIFEKIMSNPEFKEDVSDWLRNRIYRRFGGE